MKSEDVIVKSEGTLHTSPLITRLNYACCTLGQLGFRQSWPRTLYTLSVRWSRDAMLGVCCRWRPSGSLCSVSCHRLGAIYWRKKWRGRSDGFTIIGHQSPSAPVARVLWSHADTTQHTAHPYWGPNIEVYWRVSVRGGVRRGKDSTGVEEYPNQDKLRRFSAGYRIRTRISWVGDRGPNLLTKRHCWYRMILL